MLRAIYTTSITTCHTHYGSVGFRTSRRVVGLRVCHTHYGSAGFRTSRRLGFLINYDKTTAVVFTVLHEVGNLALELVSSPWG